MPKKDVFISFDYDHDRHYRYLLAALSKNAGSDIDFEDLTPEEVQSDDVGRVKAALSRRMGNCTHVLVIIGKHANSYHPDREEIGTRNWQWWEIEKASELGLRFIAVKIESNNSSPDPLYGKKAKWANTFSVDSIFRAINSA